MGNKPQKSISGNSSKPQKSISGNSSTYPKFNLQNIIGECYCDVLNVYDGDTLTLLINIQDTNYKINCRCNGYNSAELRTKDLNEKKKGIESRDYFKQLVKDRVFVVFGDNDKYGRPLITLYDTNLKMLCYNEIMIQTGHGKPYDGKGPKKW